VIAVLGLLLTAVMALELGLGRKVMVLWCVSYVATYAFLVVRGARR